MTLSPGANVQPNRSTLRSPAGLSAACNSMFNDRAPIRQGKAKAGMAEELARRVKEGAIPIISDVEGFYCLLCSVCAGRHGDGDFSIFNDYAGAEESNRRALAWIEQSLTPLLAVHRYVARSWWTDEQTGIS